MKQNIKIIALAVILVILIAVAVILYNNISKDYSPFEDAAPTSTSLGDTNEADNTVAKDIVTTTDFTVTDKDGKQVNLSDFFGKPIVVNFWATWCSPCTSEMPHFEEAYKSYGEEVTFLMVNVGDDYEDAYKYASGKGYTFPVLHDSSYSASYAYGVSSIPMTLFINADGELVNSRIGMLNKATLESNIAKIK